MVWEKTVYLSKKQQGGGEGGKREVSGKTSLPAFNKKAKGVSDGSNRLNSHIQGRWGGFLGNVCPELR